MPDKHITIKRYDKTQDTWEVVYPKTKWEDVIDHPSIPTVNNGTLTLTAGSNTKTFTANSSTNVTFEVKASDLGLSGALKYVGICTTTQPSAGEYLKLEIDSTTAIIDP